MTEKYYAFSFSKHHGRVKKITNDSAILDTFEDAKQWLIDRETAELKKAVNEVTRLRKSISYLNKIEHVTGRY